MAHTHEYLMRQALRQFMIGCLLARSKCRNLTPLYSSQTLQKRLKKYQKNHRRKFIVASQLFPLEAETKQREFLQIFEELTQA